MDNNKARGLRQILARSVKALNIEPSPLTDWGLPLLLLLALVRGGLYASLLPPWGLIDEEQHMHYIQTLVETHSLPVMGQTQLSLEIANSVVATRRWEKFHWPPMPSADPQTWGLEGLSYEAYQPPLYYVLMSPLYALLPEDMLVKVYGLRWAAVGLSLLTLWLLVQVLKELFPQEALLPSWACLILLAIPERTLAVSRINNDCLLEVMAAAFIWLSTRSLLSGLTIRRGQLLGLLLGLGVLVKPSMGLLAVMILPIIWHYRASRQTRLAVIWLVSVAGTLSACLAARNLWLYGDLTGFNGFRLLTNFSAPPFTATSLVVAWGQSFLHFWVVWWQGSNSVTPPLLWVTYLSLLALSLLGLLGIGRYFTRQWRSGGQRPILIVLTWYLLAITCYVFAVVASYFDGQVPVLQGRFLLPVVVPAIVLLSRGLWEYRHGKTTLAIVVAFLLVTDAVYLFGHLLPFFYYWSAPVAPVLVQWRDAGALFWMRFVADKPAFISGWAVILVGGYGLMLVGMGWCASRMVFIRNA